MYYLDKIPTIENELSQLFDLVENKRDVLVSGIQKGQIYQEIVFLSKQSKKQVLVVNSDREAEEFYNALKKMDIDAAIIKNHDIRFYAIEAANRDLECETVNNLNKLIYENYDVAIITSEALINKYIPKDLIKNNFLNLVVGEEINKDFLLSKLIKMGYTREHKVEGVGMFSVRGGIIDVFTPNMENPIRIEFFDSEVDSIRTFDIYTQKSIDKLKEVKIIQSKNFVLPYDDSLEKAVELMKEDTSENTNNDILYDIERIARGVYFEGIQKYIDYFYSSGNTIFDYIDEEAIFIFNDANRIADRIEGCFNEFKDSYLSALEKGFALPNQGKLLISIDEIIDYLKAYKKIYNSQLISSINKFEFKETFELKAREIQEFNGKFLDLIKEVKKLYELNYRIIFSIEDDSISSAIKKILEENNLVFSSEEKYLDNRIVFTKKFFPLGFISLSSKVAVFTKHEIYSSKKDKNHKFKHKYKTKKIESFIELKVGDYVVHESYGIGRFVAVEQKEFDNIKKDYIKIAYGNGDSLYIPLEQMSKIQRYIGNQKEDGIKLSKLGSNEWKNSKKKAKKIIELVAKDLVNLYAKRESQKGFAFPEDDVWQKEFEDDFPFVETNDQLNAIRDIKSDMQSDKIMDRLICGDVGYGKTEVALRAIFKSAINSKQSAFLVPTTVLAQQHYNTIKNRFANFPISVEVLSRFKTKKEQENVIEKLEKGEVDVLVGTHRILSKDIKFKDLGLIVIDEEQRFGVKDKEKLKNIRNNCDVISLSATPIPRTLHMSLSGIRDITTLEEPPQNRHSVLTYVTEAREGIIADAITREVNRGGQVYFVYNRVQTIDEIYLKLKKLLPDVSIEIAHGKMSARKLEQKLEDFTNKKFDVLLSTTIIETGMDIGNANTIIVYDADKMGLSQLYQLRGRVGRTSRQGYAYFLYEKDKMLTEVAEKRLKTIKEFTEFGSGFKVAMRDLEIRGAGTLLGETQHGHIADIGYELYVKMLDEEIKRLRGEDVFEVVEPEINIKLNAYIPDEYIEDVMDKIDIYKKIASIDSIEDKYEVEEEIEDRFSNIPETVYTLTSVAYVKSLAKKHKISRITKNPRGVSFYDSKGNLIVNKTFEHKTDYNFINNIAKYLESMLD